MQMLERIAAAIESEAKAHGHDLGWSYLYSPARLRMNAQLATIGLNPGGGRERSIDWQDQRQIEDPDGNSYFCQRWASDNSAFSTLQRQVHRLVDVARLQPTDVVSANLVPFRSPDWRSLKDSTDAVAFGLSLVDWALASARLKLVIAFGLGARETVLAKHLGLALHATVPTGWGRTTARIYRGRGKGTMLGVPHLSRYAVFGRPQAVKLENVVRAEMAT